MKRMILSFLLPAIICRAGPLDQGPQVSGMHLSPADRMVLQADSRTGHLYQLLRGPRPDAITQVVSMRTGTGGLLELTDPASHVRRGYYVIREVPFSSAGDTDGDGVNDLVELSSATPDNPLNPGRPISLLDGAVMVEDTARFGALSHRDNFPGAPQVREVKFLITGVTGTRWDGKKGPQIHFLNANKHQYHYYFARDVLGYPNSLGTFNNETYWSAGRKQIAGSFIHYEQFQPPGRTPGLYCMEFWPSDSINHTHVRMAWDLVTQAMPWLDAPVAYHPASVTQETLLKNEKALYDASPVRTIASAELFADVAYTQLNPGVGFGRLRIARGTETFTVRDVVVLRTLPNELTHVAGIISSAPQTALSHINLKAKQNGTPNAYVREAELRPDVLALEGKNVRYEVTPSGILLREATEAEVLAHLESLRPATVSYPPRDLTRTTILPLTGITFARNTAFGAKTANVAELRRILPAGTTPGGYGVPFYFYDEFMKYNGFYDIIREMMQTRKWSIPESREELLKGIRAMIKAGTLPPALYNAVSTVQTQMGQIPIRARSSTNNEDLPGFNGAGLYDSYTHHTDEGHLSKSLLQVWASLWNFRAVEEREFYRIDHFSAAMGVLLMPATEDEQANGVAVSKNPIDPNWTGYYVNAQLGEDLVTNPTAGAVPEEFVIAELLGAERYEMQYVSYSNRVPEGTTILTKAQAWLLADRLRTIHSHFLSLYNAWSDPDFAMEIEYKITSAGVLFIKQARPWVE